MLGFWIAAAIVSAAVGAVMLAFARRAQREGATAEASPTLAAYERQLQEVDDLARRGLLASEEREAARTEAARR
ncbi:MAG TPA: c-type cytochrome biogenesis protein CcmI, partial [Caulobacteraceae bacterium]